MAKEKPGFHITKVTFCFPASPWALPQSKNHSLPPGSLQGQTLWREFFYTIASATPNFSLMEGNPICLQIDWDQRKDLLHKWTMVQADPSSPP